MDNTLGFVLAWLLTGGGIAVVIQRLWPGWATWQSPLKGWIVLAINLAGPYALALLKMNPVIGGAWDQTLANIVIGLFMAAAAYVIHLLDQLLTAKAQFAKAQAAIAKEQAKLTF